MPAENLINANLEEKQNAHESLKKAVYVLRFTIHSELKKTPFNKLNTNYPFTFFEKLQKKPSLGSRFENKPQVAISGTEHTVTIDKN